MGKIFEALEKARQERIGLKNPQLDIVPFPGQRPASDVEFHAEKEMITLFRNIDVQLENIPSKVIQFIGAQRGEGTSTIIRDFAMVSAARLGKIGPSPGCRPPEPQPAPLLPDRPEIRSGRDRAGQGSFRESVIQDRGNQSLRVRLPEPPKRLFLSRSFSIPPR